MAQIRADQQTLKRLIDALPKMDSAFPGSDIGKYADAEKAVKDFAAQLKAQGTLATTLNAAIDSNGTTLEQYIREEKRHQLTDDGQLYNTTDARNDKIVGIDAGEQGQGHAAQRHAFISHEQTKQREATVTFIKKLKEQPGAEVLFKDGPAVFDIGYHNGNESARVAQALIDNGVPADTIAWRGMELNPDEHAKTTRTKLEAKGLKPDNIRLVGGKLGFSTPLLEDRVSENLANNLKDLRVEDKHDIVLALNVNNFGDKDLFFQQVDASMKSKDAIMVALHDAGGDALDFRKAVNAKIGRQLMGNIDAPAAKIDDVFEKQRRDVSKFNVPYEVTFPPITDEMWSAMKNIKTAAFDRDYKDDVKGTAIDPEAYKAARLQIEFLTGQPLTTYSGEERAVLLDTLKETLAAKGNVLSGKFKGQIVLSKEHSKGLAHAVQKAAAATQKELILTHAPTQVPSWTDDIARRLEQDKFGLANSGRSDY